MTDLVLLLAAGLSFRMAWLALTLTREVRFGRGLATVCLADGVMNLVVVTESILGRRYFSWPVPEVGILRAVIVAVAAVELADGLFGGPPRRIRWALAASFLGTMVVSVATGSTAALELNCLVCAGAALAILTRRLVVMRNRPEAWAIAIVLAGLSLRVLSGLLLLGRSEAGTLPSSTDALVIRRSVVPIITDILASMTVLRLARWGSVTRGVRLVLELGVAGSALALVYYAVRETLELVELPSLQQTLLVAIAFAPLAIWAAWRRVAGRVEDALAGPLDPSRRARREALEEVARAVTGAPAIDAFLASACRAASTIAGAPVRFTEAPTEGELFVPIRRRGTTHGGLVVSAADSEAETALAEVAEQVALRLEYEALLAEQLRIRAELEGAARLAALGTFAAAIAHDIRTPLTSVQMNVQILRRKVSLSPDDMEHFELALEELARLDRTTGTILEYAKPVKLASSLVDADEVIDQVLRLLAPQAEERRVTIDRARALGGAPVEGDEAKLRRVFENLLINALQASPDGATIRLSTRADDERVTVQVTDAGSGIRAEDLPKIFEPFYTTRAGGTGLGLATVARLVKAHGGDVAAETSTTGATFRVTLPRAAQQERLVTP
ncbi:MAG: ATP-binding protein [Polyangiaceae bacterium]